jgi:Tfp pilus assembly major pilin PilA
MEWKNMKKGFTIIGLLVSIAIAALILGLVIPAYQKISEEWGINTTSTNTGVVKVEQVPNNTTLKWDWGKQIKIVTVGEHEFAVLTQGGNVQGFVLIK